MNSPKLSSAQFVKMNYVFIHLIIEENVKRPPLSNYVILYVLQNFPEQQFELLYNESCMHGFHRNLRN